MGLERAAEVGRERKEKETEIAKKVARLEAGAPDLRDLVDVGRLDIDEALSLLASREAKALAEAEAAKEKARAEAEASAGEEKRAAHAHSVQTERMRTTGFVLPRKFGSTS
jgi:hypothetical protein